MTTIYIVGFGDGAFRAPSTNASVTIECWGPGGAASLNAGNGGTYCKITGQSLTGGTLYAFSIGVPGGYWGGSSGYISGDTWFNTNATILAPGGASASTAIGSTINAGGTAGTSSLSYNGGAGGAGGPAGAGSAGGNATSTGGGGGGASNANGAGSNSTTNNGANGGGTGAGAGSSSSGAPSGGDATGKGAGGGGSYSDGATNNGQGGKGGDDWDNGGGGAGGNYYGPGVTYGISNGGTPGGGAALLGTGGFGLIKITYTGTDPDQIYVVAPSSGSSWTAQINYYGDVVFNAQIPSSWLSKITGEAWGPGGSGGAGSTLAAGGSGAGGTYSKGYVTVTPGSPLSVSVGCGDWQHTPNLGYSAIGVQLRASGGQSGTLASGSTPGTGGAANYGGGGVNYGNNIVYGGVGLTGLNTVAIGGTGAGAAGSIGGVGGAGGAASGTTGGVGGNTVSGGSGGAGGTATPQAPYPGSDPRGGGGGGGGSGNAAGGQSGTGGDGGWPGGGSGSGGYQPSGVTFGGGGSAGLIILTNYYPPAATAFQSNTFQSNTFQIFGGGASGPPPTGGWGFQETWFKSAHIKRPSLLTFLNDREVLAPQQNFQPYGWEPQPPQPPVKPQIKQRGSGIKHSHQYLSFPQWYNSGWEIQSIQPRHPKPEKWAANALGDTGTENVYQPPIVTTVNDGWEATLPIFSLNPKVSQRGSATTGKSQFLLYPQWYNYGWEIQSVQPHQLKERRGAVLPKEDGTENTYLYVAPSAVNWGFDVQPYQPQHITYRGGVLANTDDGIKSQLINFYRAGWEIQAWQPPRFVKSNYKFASIARGDDGTEFTFINWRNAGWEIQPWQPPSQAKIEAQRYPGTKGSAGFAIWPQWQFMGFEPVLYQPNHPRPEKSGAVAQGDSGTENTYVFNVTFVNWSFDALPYQPQHITYRGGAIAKGEEGTEATFQRWVNGGWEIQSYQPPHLHPEYHAASIMRGDDGTESTFQKWNNAGWEIQPYQPPHRRSEKGGSIMFGDVGTEFTYLYVPPQGTGWGFDLSIPIYRKHINGGPAIHSWVEFAAFDLPIFAFEYTPPIFRKPIRIEGAVTGFVEHAAFDTQPYMGDLLGIFYKINIAHRGAGIKHSHQYKSFPQWFNAGWEIQSVQPPVNPKTDQRGSATTGKSQFLLYPQWINAGWEIQAVQPPHLKPEKAGAIMPREDGIEAKLVVQLSPWPFELYQQQPPHPHPEYKAAIMRGDDGTAAKFQQWLNAGWEVQPPQPPAPSTEPHQKFAGISSNIYDGIEAVYLPWYNAGWEIQAWQPPHPHPEYRAAGIMRGDDGVENIYNNWRNFGWEIQPPQPPHPHPEYRAASIMRGDDGIEYVYMRWFNGGWEIQSPQPPSKPSIRSKQAGIARWEDGMAVYVYVPPVILPYTPIVKFIGNVGNFMNR